MAGVTTTPGPWQQVGLVAGLRWRLLRNSLRSERAQLELTGTFLVVGLGAVMALGGAVGFAAGAFSAVRRNSPQIFVLLLWVVLLVWQLLPLMIAAFSAGAGMRGLLYLPFRFRAFFLLNLFYGLSDPAAILGVVWLVAAAAGVAMADLALLPWTALLLLVFGALCLFLNRVIYLWLERLLARRRTREILFVVFILAMLSLQFVGVAAERWGKTAAPYLQTIYEWAWILPPGLVGMSVFGARGFGLQLAAALLLALYAAAFGLLLRRRLLAQYRGEDLGETLAPQQAQAARREPAGELEWELPGVSHQVAAIFYKEVRYLLRNSALLMNLFVPLLIFVFIAFAQTAGEKSQLLSRAPKELLFPAAIGYAMLVLTQSGHNSFAFDGRGIQFFLVAPLRFREVLLGKNLVLGMLIAVEFAAIWVFLAFLVAVPGPAVTLTTLAAAVFIGLVNFSVGNYLSLAHPRRFDFGKFRQRQSGMTVLVALAVQLFTLGLCGSIFAAAYFLKMMWLAALVLILLAAAAFGLYRWSLERCSQLAGSKREVLTAELCKD